MSHEKARDGQFTSSDLQEKSAEKMTGKRIISRAASARNANAGISAGHFVRVGTATGPRR
jgi:hypothetical protein